MHFLSADLLITDRMVELNALPEAERAEIQVLMDEGGIIGNDKTAIGVELSGRIAAALQGVEIPSNGGGSAANTLITLLRMNKNYSADFFGVAGNEAASDINRHDLADAWINLFPAEPVTVQPDNPPTGATSYVFVYPDGSRSAAVCRGNIKDYVTPEMITDELVSKADVILAPGSLRYKLGEEFMDRLLKLRWDHGKPLILTLPTQSQLAAEESDKFRFYIPSANVVLSNEKELARVYETLPENADGSIKDEKYITEEEWAVAGHKALKELHKMMKENSHILAEKAKETGNPALAKQVAFITLGKAGAAVLTPDMDEPLIVPGITVPASEIKNSIGCGDTAFGGFLWAYYEGLSLNACAQVANTLAAEKIKINAARLPDPLASLETTMPMVATLTADRKERTSIGK